jgi:predicted secreted protein
MATTAQTPAPRAAKRIPMDSTRKTALVAGVFYLITFVSIPTLALYGPVKDHRDWILGSGSHTGLLVGGFLEVIVALAGIGTAVTLYPVVKRQNGGVALGFVAARVLEAGMIFTGVVSLLSLVTLRQDLGGAAGADSAAPVTTAASHVAVYNWTFLLSQSLMPGINALLLGSLLYRSRLVPRIIPALGLIGAPLLIGTVIATVFGGLKLGSPELAALPVAAWELSLGVWLVVKGFRPCPITTGMTAADTAPAYHDVTA